MSLFLCFHKVNVPLAAMSSHFMPANQQPPQSLPSAHVAVLLVACMWVTLGSEEEALTGRGLHTGDTHRE